MDEPISIRELRAAAAEEYLDYGDAIDRDELLALLDVAEELHRIAQPLNQRAIADGYENIVTAWQQRARDALARFKFD